MTSLLFLLPKNHQKFRNRSFFFQMVKRKLHQKEHYGQLLSEFGTLQERINHHGDSDNEGMVDVKTRILNNFDYVVLACLTLMGVLYFLTYFESFHWHLSACCRILLIKLLSIYDWGHMKNKQCLIERHANLPVGNFFNCDLCENINIIDVVDSLDEDVLEDRYIHLDVPVVLTNGLEHWPKNSSFFDDLLLDEDFSSSFPCKLSSNIVKDLSTAGDILARTKNFGEFFVHFQNCEQAAMRVLRRFTFRPANIPATYSPSTYNWVIWNKSYNATGYKAIDLIEKLTVFGQIAGTTHIKLIPRSNCKQVCSILQFNLLQGEMLVFTSLWDLEYRCNEVDENVAVIMEIRD